MKANLLLESRLLFSDRSLWGRSVKTSKILTRGTRLRISACSLETCQQDDGAADHRHALYKPSIAETQRAEICWNAVGLPWYAPLILSYCRPTVSYCIPILLDCITTTTTIWLLRLLRPLRLLRLLRLLRQLTTTTATTDYDSSYNYTHMYVALVWVFINPVLVSISERC